MQASECEGNNLNRSERVILKQRQLITPFQDVGKDSLRKQEVSPAIYTIRVFHSHPRITSPNTTRSPNTACLSFIQPPRNISTYYISLRAHRLADLNLCRLAICTTRGITIRTRLYHYIYPRMTTAALLIRDSY